MGVEGQAVARHLVFVLEDQTVVVQRGADWVEALENREPRAFTSHDHHHDITDEELKQLRLKRLVLQFDEQTVWLPPQSSAKPDPGTVRYFYLDTKLSAPYLRIVQSLLHASDYEGNFFAQVHGNRVAVMGPNGEPFESLPDAEAAYTLLKQALGDHLAGLAIARLDVDTTLFDSQMQPPSWRDQLLRQAATPSLAEYSLLLVEEDPAVVAAVLEGMGEPQPQIRLASSGSAALEILMDEEPDIVILQLSLTDVHGYEVIAHMKRNPLTLRVPVILLGDTSTERDIAFALYVAQVDEYLVKPVDPQRLRQRVIHLLTRQYQ